jgi:hypothetical protein
MPRQPYLKMVDRDRSDSLDFSIAALDHRSDLQLIIARCFMAWPIVEIEMAMILGHLLGTKDAAAVAVFEQLRRSSAQREAIMAAANIILEERDKELMSASLNAHKAIESDRNAFAHGHFGVSDLLPDAVVWMSSSDYAPIRSKSVLIGRTPTVSEITSKVYVYRLKDLKDIFNDVEWLLDYWVSALGYLRTPYSKFGTREELYLQLCDQPRIARELVILRQKNNQSKPPQSPPPAGGGQA